MECDQKVDRRQEGTTVDDDAVVADDDVFVEPRRSRKHRRYKERTKERAGPERCVECDAVLNRDVVKAREEQDVVVISSLSDFVGTRGRRDFIFERNSRRKISLR